MEKIIDEIEELEKELKKQEEIRNFLLSISWKYEIEEKVEKGKVITKKELENYAKIYNCDCTIENLENQIEEKKKEFVEKKERFFEYLKKI